MPLEEEAVVVLKPDSALVEEPRKQEGPVSTTSRLLDAKRRAQKKMD